MAISEGLQYGSGWANEKAGTIRSGITNDDFFLAIAGIWQMDAQSEWRLRLARLMNLVMDGLCAGSPESLKKNNA